MNLSPKGPTPDRKPKPWSGPGGRVGTSAWFGSGPKPPAETGQDWLESLESWSGASGDTVRGDGRSDSSGVPVTAAASGGATADRTGEGRRVVRTRIPDGEVPAQASPSNARSDEHPEQEETPEQELSPLTGAEGVAAPYWKLPAEERSRSASSLALQLAEGTPYKVGTVRKYLGETRRAERQDDAAD